MPAAQNLPTPDSVFVYGTLRRGEKNFPLYLAGKFLSCVPASVPGQLYFESTEGYPYLKPGPGRVQGEIFRLDPATAAATLQRLDRLEDYDPGNEAASLYLRRSVTARRADGGAERVWVYYWNGPDIGQLLPDGDFSARRRGRT